MDDNSNPVTPASAVPTEPVVPITPPSSDPVVPPVPEVPTPPIPVTPPSPNPVMPTPDPVVPPVTPPVETPTPNPPVPSAPADPPPIVPVTPPVTSPSPSDFPKPTPDAASTLMKIPLSSGGIDFKKIAMGGIAVFILLIIGGLGVLFVFGKAQDQKLTAAVPTPSVSVTPQQQTIALTTQYNNPFDAKTQYTNPFDKQRNPFDSLNQQ